ncbi:TonB-dependent receptor [Sphingobium sp.]|uniref:TonB-dependent receptor n=1 Tax=Sphingobium sp. TaxID=1912891 RepID=UPI0028BDE1AB|nr:TonB-dependent receptor [Sphingobium sp.]
MRSVLLASTAVVGVFAGALAVMPARAQTADQAGQGSGLAEIVVTAQRKEESVQKAAIAIDAVSGDALASQGITSAAQITKAVPALSLATPGGNVTSIFLRGVGNTTTSSWNDPAVTPNYDGVVLGRASGAFGASFYDLARIEVLKGPQGILYGRNATGGAVNIIPARPKLGETGGGFNVSYGNYDAVNADGYVNLAIGDTSALRISGMRQIHDPYNRDGTDDLKRSGLRGQFLFEPRDGLSLRIGADWTHLGGKGIGANYLGSYVPNASGTYDFVPVSFDPSEGINTTAANAYRQTQLGAPGFGFLAALNRDQSFNSTYWGVNAELNVDTGLGKLTVIPAYRKSKDRTFFYAVAFNTGNTNEDTAQASLEARLSGKRGIFDYVLGGFYFHEKIKADNEYNQEFVLPIQRYTQKTDSWAAFGQLTAHLSDRFRLVGGLRYTHDHKDMNGLINNFITFCGGVPGVPGSPGLITPPGSFAQGCAAPGALPHFPNFLNTGDMINWLVANGWISSTTTDQPNAQVLPLLNGVAQILKTYNPVIADGSYSRVTWKAAAEYDLAPGSLLYASVESGYRAGGFQLAEGRPSYRPEYITAYTIGSKNRFFNNRVQLNIEAFYWKYRNQQINYFTVDTSGALISSTENAGRSTIKGFDIDAIVKPASRTTLNAKVQYLKAQYDDLHLFTAAPRDNFNCPFTYTGQIAGGAPVKDLNCSGKPLLYSPKWTVNLGAEQVVPINDRLEIAGNVNTAWRDSQYGGFEYLPFEHIPAYWTTDLGLSLRQPDGRWAMTGFILNLENKRRDLSPQASPIGFAIAHYSAPRTYGVRLSADF